MYRVVMQDKRVQLYENLGKLCETPRGALAFAEAAVDRLEGKPVQKHEVAPARTTIFAPAPDPGDEPHAGSPLPAPPTNGAPKHGGPLTLTGLNGERFRPI
jgi:hypothetical protein